MHAYPRHTRTGEDTDSPPAAGTRHVGSDPGSCSSSTELLARLTHAVPPTAGFGNRHSSCPSGWGLKTPTGSSSWHGDPARSSHWHHRPGAPTPRSDRRSWHQIPLTHTQVSPVAGTESLQHTFTRDREMQRDA